VKHESQKKNQLDQMILIDCMHGVLGFIDPRSNIKYSYRISTSSKGLGQLNDSGCTPSGWHCIRAKIGTGVNNASVFVGRRPTGECYDDSGDPNRDWILTRILWLSGLEPGLNRGGQVDTMRRYIYIHGSPEWGIKHKRASHGCVRMRCSDMIELFDMVKPYCLVYIGECLSDDFEYYKNKYNKMMELRV
jgi:hypothetical protein